MRGNHLGTTIGAGLAAVLFAAAGLACVLPAGADVMPADRRIVWNPGIPGGIPARATVCATLKASAYQDGRVDATKGIQSAIDACPDGQVVQLSAGDFLVDDTYPITIGKGVVLRGAGPPATRLRKVSDAANPLIVIGQRWNEEDASADLTANA